MLDTCEKAICRKIASMFEYAGKTGYRPVSFTTTWLESDTSKELYTIEPCAIAQSYPYHLHSLEKEMQEKGIVLSSDTSETYEDVMYWAGYIFSYWIFLEGISGDEIIEKYDIKHILECYDTYHTLSPEVAIDKIKEDWNMEQNAFEDFLDEK